MIGELIGKISNITENYLILNVNNVGYVVYISTNILNKLEIGMEIKMLIETKFKVDKIVLFGFLNEFQKMIFNYVGNVNGISDKIAQSVATSFLANDFLAFYNDSLKLTIKIDGCGAKSWEKILFSIKGDKNFYNKCLPFVNNSDTTINNNQFVMINDAASALILMGIARQKSFDLINNIIKNAPEIKIEELIKKALADYAH